MLCYVFWSQVEYGIVCFIFIPTNKVGLQLIYSFIFETGCKYFKYYNIHIFYDSLEKVEKRLKSFSSHALHGSHTKIKISDNPTQ